MDFYRILGIARDASQQEVKNAWRREALKNHPDRLQDASAAEKALALQRFREVKEAYEVLGDETKRALYNTSGRSAVYAAQRRSGGTASPYQSGFTARSGWSNFRYQQQCYNRHGGAMFSMFRGFTSSMGRADAYFHVAFAGILVMGFVLVAPLADTLWERRNEGKLFKHIRPVTAQEVKRERAQGEDRLREQGVPLDVIAAMRAFDARGFAAQVAPGQPAISAPQSQGTQPPAADAAASAAAARIGTQQPVQVEVWEATGAPEYRTGNASASSAPSCSSQTHKEIESSGQTKHSMSYAAVDVCLEGLQDPVSPAEDLAREEAEHAAFSENQSKPVDS